MPAHQYDQNLISGRPFPSSSTLFTSVPIPPLMNTRTSSPCWRCVRGSLAKPVPFGVPVSIIDPGSNVVPWDNVATALRMENICFLNTGSISTPQNLWCRAHDVFPSCITFPFTKVRKWSVWGSPIEEAETIQGPKGVVLSKSEYENI